VGPLAAVFLAAPELEAVLEVIPCLQLADIDALGRLGIFAESEAALQELPSPLAADELVAAVPQTRLEGRPSVTLAGVLAGGRIRLDASPEAHLEATLGLLSTLVLAAALLEARLEERARAALAQILAGGGGGLALLEAMVELCTAQPERAKGWRKQLEAQRAEDEANKAEVADENVRDA